MKNTLCSLAEILTAHRFRLGLSQFADLHLGQIRTSAWRGVHVQPHCLHFRVGTSIVAMPIGYPMGEPTSSPWGQEVRGYVGGRVSPPAAPASPTSPP